MNLFLEKLSLGSFFSTILFIRDKDYELKNVDIQYLDISRFMTWVKFIYKYLNIISVEKFYFKLWDNNLQKEKFTNGQDIK